MLMADVPAPPPAAPTAALGPPPDAIDRFTILGELGRGGMGRVYEAYDPTLGRVVALKVLAGTRPELGHWAERFVAEARIAAQLEHPNIVPVYEMGTTEDGDPFFVMRKMEGRTLAEVLAGLKRGEPEGEWTRHRLLSAFTSVCHAIAFAHRRGILHRDIKPANIMVGSYGEVHLLDWGVARVLAEPWVTETRPTEAVVKPGFSGLTHAGAVVGTPGYISPEQVAGVPEALDERADVFGLGALLYEILTLERAFAGKGRIALERAVDGSVEDPRLKAPDRRIPDEMAEVCLGALEFRPADRPESAEELGRAVERFLDGSGRRERARKHLDEAVELWADYVAVDRKRARLAREVAALEETIEGWRSLEEKAELLAARAELAGAAPDRASLFGRALGAAERALSQDPGNPEARAFLAKAFWVRFLEAEAAGDRVRERYFSERVEAFDDGALLAAREGVGRLTVRSEPEGAEVLCSSFDRAGVVWARGEERSLGTTPLVDVPVPMGSHVLRLRAAGREATVPVRIGRQGRWDTGTVRLRTADEVGEGFAYVPGGRFTFGGDGDAQDAAPRDEIHVDDFAVAVFPVTQGEYAEFLTDLAGTDPEDAWRRCPRQAQGVEADTGQFWGRPAPGMPYAVPEQDRDGDRWDPSWPVFGISWHDAVTYAAWRSERDGVTYDLPTEREWEKAARGADGRFFPWGDTFDPSLCAMRYSRPGRPQPQLVGAFEGDVSVYGVRDLAGGVRDWCGDTAYRSPERRPLRGGSWDSHEQYCRLTHRTGYLSTYSAVSFGFRLVRRFDD